MGFLFSPNAVKASVRSAVGSTSSYAKFSLLSPFSQPLTACKAARMAIGPPSQMSFARDGLAQDFAAYGAGFLRFFLVHFYQAVGEAHEVGFGTGDAAACEDHVAGASGSDQSGESVGSTWLLLAWTC